MPSDPFPTRAPTSADVLAKLNQMIIDSANQSLCRRRALFLETVSSKAALAIAFLLIMPFIGFIVLLFKLAQAKEKPDAVVANTSNSTTQPDVENPIIHADASAAQPPPYSETPKPEPRVFSKSSNASLFVLGSAVFPLAVLLLVVLALCIQNVVFCPAYDANYITGTVILWIVFTAPAVGVAFAVGCWLVLLRNLWGKRGRERWPINSDIVAIPGVVIVDCIQGLQKRYCGDALDEEEGVADEVEMEAQTLLAGIDGNGEDEDEDGAYRMESTLK